MLGRPAAKFPEGERKTVTALFADIKGSMDLMEDIDLEEARAIVDPALKLMMDAAHRYDGYIVQSTGDGIFAIFGAPVAHEDHPQRALHAALRMQEDLKRYADKLREQGQPPLLVRVGVNTGEVVVRSIRTGDSHTEYTPIGHSMSLASRLQTLAAPGSVVIGQSVQRFVEGYFQLKTLGASRIKGVSEPVAVFEVTGLGPLRTRLQRSAGRGYTKFVGREREMEVLKHAAEQAKAGQGQIVAAMAEAGTGKSRLYFEFKAKHQSGWMVLETFSVSHGKASAYLPVLDLLHGYFKIAGEDDERTRREKVAGKIAILDRSLEDTLSYLFSLLGIVEGDDPLAQMDGQSKKRRTLEAIKRILLRESLNQPLMVIFEDLHWLDEATQELLNLLADSLGTAKILLLVNYRPEYSHQWGSKTYYTQLRLDPLGQESATEMLTALLGDGKDLFPLRRLIIERTDGTPFFIEEMVQALFEEGALVRNGTVKLARSMDAVKVPATVQGVLAAHIDRLPVDEKELLQTLAALGREFPFSLVRRVTLKPEDELEGALSRLQSGEFIYEQPAAGDIEYIFKHALTQEVAYNSVLLERRKLLHERAGVALESIYAGQLDDHLNELAHHYSRSDNVAKAVEYLELAGRQALERCAYVDAISSLSAGLNLVEKLADSRERIERELHLQLALGPALIIVRGYAKPEVERAYARARVLCSRIGKTPELFPVVQGLWAFYLLRGQCEKAYELAEEVFTLAESGKDSAVLIQQASFGLGNSLLWLGEFPAARIQLEQAIKLDDPSRHRSSQIVSINSGVFAWAFLGHVLWYLGYPDQAVKANSTACVLASELSQPYSLALARTFSCWLNQYRVEGQPCRTLAESNIALSTELGFAFTLSQATVLRGWARAEQGEVSEGIAEIREGITSYRATGAELETPYWLSLLAGACAKAGRLEEGEAAVVEALSEVRESKARFCEAELHRVKGDLILASGGRDSETAEGCYHQALKMARGQGAKSLELRATMSLARLLAKLGRRDEARTMLTDIYGWFTEGFDTADLKDAKALLDEISA